MLVAKTTSPVCWLMIAMPDVFDPVSILSFKSGFSGSDTSLFKMIVNGSRRKTAALPRFKSRSARRKVVGAKGFLVVSKTATFMFFFGLAFRLNATFVFYVSLDEVI